MAGGNENTAKSATQLELDLGLSLATFSLPDRSGRLKVDTTSQTGLGRKRNVNLAIPVLDIKIVIADFINK